MGGDAEAAGDPTRRRSMVRRLAGRGGLLLVTAVALYLVFPSLVEVFSSWDEVSDLEPGWFLLVGGTQLVSFACIWALQRIALRTTRWLPVVTSQLAGNAATRLIPGGPAAGTAVQFRLLRTSGVSTANATSGLTAATLLQLATTFALPLIALPAVIFGDPAPRSLLAAAWLGAVLFVVLLLLAIAGFTDDRLLGWLGRLVDALRGRIPFLRPAEGPTAVVLLAERDELLGGLGNRWTRAASFAAGRAVFDFLSLMSAVIAFGVEARPSLVLLAYATALILGMIPLTPGGLGFVEVGLTGALALAGLSAGEALGVALLYRLVSFWLPIPVGMAAAVVHQAKYGGNTRSPDATA
jgi:uncharacterized membrane protein YbhN (UPF0104 family)